MVSNTDWNWKDYIKLIGIIIATLFAIFGLGFTILSLIFWLVLGFQIEFIISAITFFVLTLIPGFLIQKHGKIFDDYLEKINYKKPKSTISKEIMIKYLIYLIILILLNNFFNGFLGPFPYEIDGKLALEILKIIINVDGILLGFSGLIFVRVLSDDSEINKTPIILITLLFLSSVLKGITNMSLINETAVSNVILLPPIQFMMSALYFLIIYIISYSHNNT